MKLDELNAAEMALLSTQSNWVAMAELADAMVDGVAIIDSAGDVRLWSNEAARLTGWEGALVVGRTAERVLPVQMLEARGVQRRHVLEASVVARTGKLFPVEFRVGQVMMEAERMDVMSFRDVTVEREQTEKLRKVAHSDTLTGLPNRAMLYEMLPKYISMSNRYHLQVAVLFVDLDCFKPINDTYGHDVGDKVLREISARLRQCVRSEDAIGRLGGDEFVALLYGVHSREDAAMVADRIQGACSKPVVTDRGTFELSASIGIAIYPQDATDGPELLKAADQAMYAAKEAGKAQYAFFSAEMDRLALEKMELKESLRAAIIQGQFVLHFQPQIDLASKRTVGAEALIRWERPGHGMVPPGMFIPLAEESGLIVQIGEWALREACVEAKRWLDMGLNDGKGLVIGVNLSTRQFTPALPELVFSVLRETGLPPHLLDLEITESFFMSDVEAGICILQQLADHGVSVSVDDFGTGYSSLEYLRRLPVHTIKVDRTFVNDIHEPASRAIVEMVVMLAERLGRRTLAEGVETEEHSAQLLALGVESAQGYLFSKPVGSAAFLGLVGG